MKNTTNSVQLLAKLQTLLDVRKNFVNDTEINKIIADTTEEFVAAFNTKISDYKKPKSEMPCNCAESPKTLQDIIDEAKAKLTDKKTFAAIVFRAD